MGTPLGPEWVNTDGHTCGVGIAALGPLSADALDRAVIAGHGFLALLQPAVRADATP